MWYPNPSRLLVTNDTRCHIFTFKEAEDKGFGVSNEGWTWFDDKLKLKPAPHANWSGGAEFTFGERDVQKIVWDWEG